MEKKELNKKVLAAIKLVPVHDKATMAQMFNKVKETTEDAADWANNDALQEELRPIWAEIAENFEFIKPE